MPVHSHQRTKALLSRLLKTTNGHLKLFYIYCSCIQQLNRFIKKSIWTNIDWSRIQKYLEFWRNKVRFLKLFPIIYLTHQSWPYEIEIQNCWNVSSKFGLRFVLLQITKMLSASNFGSLRNLVISFNRKHIRQVNNKFCFVFGRREKKYKQSLLVEVDNIFAICNNDDPKTHSFLSFFF
jgi:hypothetical protein